MRGRPEPGSDSVTGAGGDSGVVNEAFERLERLVAGPESFCVVATKPGKAIAGGNSERS